MLEDSIIPQKIKDLPSIFHRLYMTTPEIVTRKTLSELSGGIVSPKTLANLDTQNRGPTGRVLWGKKVVYPRDEAILWLYNYTQAKN